MMIWYRGRSRKLAISTNEPGHADVLLSCLSFAGSSHPLAFSATVPPHDESWSRLLAMARLEDLLPAVADRLAPHCFDGSDCPEIGSGRTEIELHLRRYLADFAYRCRSQSMQLAAVCAAMNSVGIEPVLMACAKTLWDGVPRWRYVREIAVLVAQAELPRACAALVDLGYVSVRRLDRTGYRRETHWVSPHLCGWLALRTLDANSLIARLLPASESTESSARIKVGEAVARVLCSRYDLMHSMLDWHSRPRLWNRGSIPIRMVYEFAWQWNALTARDRAAIHDRARQDPVLSQVLDAWIEIAARHFDLPAAMSSAVSPAGTDMARLQDREQSLDPNRVSPPTERRGKAG